MTLNTFAPIPGPSPGTSRKTKPKVLQAEFGDGYTQSVPDGINFLKRSITLRWDGLTYAQKEAIISFFEQHGGYQPFYYTMTGDASATRWLCTDWEDSIEGAWKINANLKQYYGVLT